MSGVLIERLRKGEDSEEMLESVLLISNELQRTRPDEQIEILNAASDWICKNSSSKKLEPLLGLCIAIHQVQGYVEDFVFPLNEEEEIQPVSAFISCVLSLLNSILKSPQAEKYIKLLSKLLSLSCFLAEQKTVPDTFRRKGTLKFILTLYKNLVKASAKSEQSLKVLTSMSDFFAKSATFSNKCREYLIRKGAIQVFCLVLSPSSVYQESKIVFKTLYALGTLAGTNDQQLLVWVSGGTSLAISLFSNPEFLEPASFVLWKCSIDAAEVQESLFSSSFVDKALNVLATKPDPKITTYLIGILRRIVTNPAYKDLLSRQISEVFLVWLKELTKQTHILPLKELVAGLGSICTKPEVAQEVVKAAGIEILLELIIRHLREAKLTKTCVGMLVNLSVQDGILERIVSNIKFYESINGLIDIYSNSSFMMEYVLKLILNGLQNNSCLFHLSERVFMGKISKVLQFSKNDENMFVLIVCILRVMVSHSNGYTEKGMEEFKASFAPSSIGWVLEGFQKSLGNLKALTESVLLISAISQEEGGYLEYLKNCQELGLCIKVSLEFYANDKTSTAMLTECLANLPVEEFNMIL